MNVTLSPQTQLLIHERMRAGGFATADELVRLALETFEINGEDVEVLDPETQSAIDRAEAQSARGEGMSAKDEFGLLRTKHLGK